MRLTIAALLALVAVAVAPRIPAAEPARTQEAVYNVELVIFRPLTPLGIEEDWGMEATRGRSVTEVPGDEEEGAVAANAADSRVTVSSLSPALFKLGPIVSSLQRNRGYELIAHLGWTQAAVPRGSGLMVDLQEVGLSGLPVRGAGVLERGRYLYLRLDLSYAPAEPPVSLVATAQGAGSVTFLLKQVRRLRPFERHYFDHPAFGVIAMISPVT